MHRNIGSLLLLSAAMTMAGCICPARSSPAAAPQVRDGSHDFDFLYGSWLMHNQRLRGDVLSSHDWAKFDATDTAGPLPGGLGNADFYSTSYPRKGFVGMTVRLYDRKAGIWRLYWIDNLNSHGDAGQPNIGRWRGNIGIFDEHMMFHGKPVIDRYTWTRFGAHSKITAHFQESLSADGGRTWKVVFANDLIRSAPRPAASVSDDEQTPQSAAGKAPDGSHDFDFEYGKWRMPNHRLVKRLVGSHQWDDFVTCDEGVPLPGGIGDMDVLRANYWPNFVGVTLRTYDPQSGLWRLYWVDNRFSQGVLQPPVVGRFNGNVGVFKGNDTYDGKPIIGRFIWTVAPKGAKVVAKWQQAFSTDGGKTWEVNWRNELIRDDHCTPTTPPA